MADFELALVQWHNRMKKISRKVHPNLYEILELFQREQAATEVTIQQLETGGVRNLRGRRSSNAKRRSSPLLKN